MSMKTSTVFLAILLMMNGLGAQEKQEKKEQPAPPSGPTASAPGTPAPHVFTFSAQDKARKNPIRFTELSVERGKKIYLTQCALCHGKSGDGKGEMVEEMKITPPDFTKPETLKGRTDGELFAIIGAGKDPMPGQSGRMTDLHRWNLVNYLRALSGKSPEKASGKEPEENVILVPPT
jgi:mono/diheme cytochrome c family protein